MNQELFDKLIEAGMTPETATEIAKGSYDGAPDTEESVDVDALTKAMGEIKDIFEKSRPESVDADLDTSISVEDADDGDLVKAVSQGADRILAQSQAHIAAREAAQNAIFDRLDALSKGFLALAESNQLLQKAIEASDGDLKKSLAAVKDELAAPNAPKAIVGEVLPAPADTDLSKSLTPNDVVTKALAEMEGTDDLNRRRDLGHAIAKVESGMNPHVVANDYHIDMKV